MTEHSDLAFVDPQLTIENMDSYYIRKSILSAIKEHLPEFSGTLLDLGCGEMPYRRLLTSPPSNVDKYIGIDILNPTYQQHSRPDVFWDGTRIPLAGASVDCAIATEFFEHVPHPEAILPEVLRVLRPSGILFFTVPFVWPLHTMPHDEYRYTPFALERIFKDSGFIDTKLRALGGWDASLAQVIGLWTRRRPMPEEDRVEHSEALFPFYKRLIQTDRIPKDFSDSMLITGLAGTARKAT